MTVAIAKSAAYLEGSVHRISGPLSLNVHFPAHAQYSVQRAQKFKSDFGANMSNPYSVDLRWRVVWLNLVYRASASKISRLLRLSELKDTSPCSVARVM